MKQTSRCGSRLSIVLLLTVFLLAPVTTLAAEPLPLRRAVELAISHGSVAGAAAADEQRAFASYHEARNQYLPQLVAGSGLGATWGFPLSLEGAAPSLLNVNSQSTVFSPALRDFVRAAKTDWNATALQAKDQRNQVIQDTVLSYAELNKWETLLGHLQDVKTDSEKMEKVVGDRIEEGVDNPQARNQAKLVTARARLRMAEAQGAIDVLRNRLSQLTGLPASSIETVADSIPALPAMEPADGLAVKAAQDNPAAQAADIRAVALNLRARGEHKAMWPSVDFAAQYALLSTFNNYDQYFAKGSFQRHNATIGVVIRFPFFSPTQHAHAEAADAEALRARKDAETTHNQVSEATLKLQRSMEQLSAAQEVAELEYQIAHSNLESLQVRMDAGTGTLHDLADANTQTTEHYNALQDANFELERARITLLRSTGQLEAWLGMGK